MSATAAAVSAANIILIPTSPAPADVWEAGETAAFAQGKNGNAVVRIVLNRTRSFQSLAIRGGAAQRARVNQFRRKKRVRKSAAASRASTAWTGSKLENRYCRPVNGPHTRTAELSV